MSTKKPILLLILVGFAAGYTLAQTTAEAAAISSNSGMSTQMSDFSARAREKLPSLFDHPVRQQTATSPKRDANGPLIAPSGPPPDEVNRKKFEQSAGKDPGRVLFRSVPNGADVFVNHLLVGHTPLLMFLAPGRYEVEMHGARQESGHRTVGVMPKETQSVLIDLNQKYPANVSIRW
jgi:hypothetical protein